MENNKDIGKMVAETMEQGLKSPKASLWDRLDNSLEKREKKRRRALWFWYTGTGVLILLILGIWGFSNHTLKYTKRAPVTSSEIVTNDIESVDENKESIISQTSEVSETTEIETLKQETHNTNEENTITSIQQGSIKPKETKANTPQEKISEGQPKTDTMTENGFTVKTNHSYYNSDIDTTVVSTNKKQIDSLVRTNKQKMALKDSIARARAADSIKLNEARKDSIPE